MNYLLDTCFLSEFTKPVVNAGVEAWFDAQPLESLFVSVITLAELKRGVLRLAEGKKKVQLLTWLDGLEQNFASRLLLVDLATVNAWAAQSVALEKQGKHLAFPDALIAANAVQHGMTLVTRNIKDFEQTAVALINPWLDSVS
jgi:predicted nucleic acid-binding protein